MNGVASTKIHHRRRRNDFFFGPLDPGFLFGPPPGLVFVSAPGDAAALRAFPVDGGRLEVCLGLYRSPLEVEGRSRDTVARC
jgi:hypothetical protein